MPPEGSQPSFREKIKMVINPKQNVGKESATMAPVVAR